MQHACLLAGLMGGGWMPSALIKGVAGTPRDENSAFRRILALEILHFVGNLAIKNLHFVDNDIK